jgi:zinc protease
MCAMKLFEALRRLSVAALLAALLTPLSAAAQPTRDAAPRPWLYQNSDVPIDTDWHFGVLENGLRYAVRRNQVPARLVAIRVRVDVGALMEAPDESGYAHFIEHLSFRGSRAVPDGESKRIWQRLGVDFGYDSNAQTSNVSTSYAVDLPDATPAGIAESLRILAGMVSAPNIVPSAVEAERSVVLAERRENLGPASEIGDETRRFYYAGQRLATSSPIGTEATIGAATPERLRAFHDRWYRPERTVVVLSGDAEPAALAAMVRSAFGTWQVPGAAAPIPDFGFPDPKAPATKVIVKSDFPPSLGLAWLRAWRPHDDTIAYNQARIVDDVALQLINRRLEAAANSGGAFIQAQVEQDMSARTVHGTYVTITPIGDDWEKALREVRAIIEDARRTAPSQTDIDREYVALEAGFARGVATVALASSANQADMVVGAVDIRETVVTPQAQLDIYRGARQFMTPEQLRDSTQRLFAGDVSRTLLTLKSAQPNAQARLDAAMRAAVQPARNVRLDARRVTMAALPALGTPGAIAIDRPLGALSIQQITFENGVVLFLRANKAEPGKVRIKVRFGHGRQSFSPEENDALWAAPYALMASGIADLDKNALDELANGRELSLNFGIDDDAFTFASVSSPQDYPDQLRLLATKLAFPRWDATPLARMTAMLESRYDAMPSSAGEALERDLAWLLSGKDGRLAPPMPGDAEQLKLERFKEIWAPRLATGRIEIQIFGDVIREEAVAAVAASFGALPQRPETVPPTENKLKHFPTPNSEPLRLTHGGAREQAAVAIAWPTGGGSAQIREGRQLEILARIIGDRLFEKLRSIDGAAYTPSAFSTWPETSETGGFLAVQTQLKPERVPYFFGLIREIAADLAASPVTVDELSRQIEPVRKLLERARSSNAFWMDQLEGMSRDPRRLLMASSYGSDLTSVKPEDIQALARRYLKSDTQFSMVVLAKGVPMPAMDSRQMADKSAARPGPAVARTN